jgi:hypothetical protein
MTPHPGTRVDSGGKQRTDKTKNYMNAKRMPLLFHLFALVALLALPACKNLETAAYKTIGATAITVDGAMNGWGDYVRAGLAKPSEEAAVKAAYEKYQGAMQVLKVAVRNAKTNPEGESDLDRALRTASVTAGELVSLVRVLTSGSLKPAS